uniref:Phosphatidylinositol-glycan biosynthesis class W protein n=1 Tax=Caenorhabditis tropicalis TaxID=1561998 RepID=A0A1I7UGX2_9PELO
MSSDDEHSRFVGTLVGCAQRELFQTFLIIMLGLFIRNLTMPWIFLGQRYDTNRSTYWLKFVADLVFLCLPALLSMTVLSNHLNLLTTVLSLISTVLLLFVLFEASEYHLTRNLRQAWSRIVEEQHRPTKFVTYFRSLTMIVVTVAILAVDFPVFPRKYAKTERFGHSMMDVGVAAFVFQAALGSRMAKSASSGRTLASHTRPWYLSSTFLLFALGFGRAIVLELIGYPQHVTEYGIHWNFFFTMAAIRVLYSILPRCYPLVLSVIFGICHQTMLKSTGLQKWILDETANQRENLMTANAEGLTSLLGYVTIFYASLAIGEFMAKTSCRVKSWIRRCFQLLIISFTLFLIQLATENLVDPPCRRVVNISYIFSQLALMTFATGICLSIQMFSIVVWCAAFPQFSRGDDPFSTVSPCLTDSINRHSLLFFLISNLLTGIINLLIPTHSISSPLQSIPILFLYITVSTLSVHFLEYRKVNFKRLHEE